MPTAIILKIESYRRTRGPRSGPQRLRALALDRCEEAYLRRDWIAFDRWLRILSLTRRGLGRTEPTPIIAVHPRSRPPARQ